MHAAAPLCTPPLSYLIHLSVAMVMGMSARQSLQLTWVPAHLDGAERKQRGHVALAGQVGQLEPLCRGGHDVAGVCYETPVLCVLRHLQQCSTRVSSKECTIRHSQTKFPFTLQHRELTACEVAHVMQVPA